LGRQVRDGFRSFDDYCQAISDARAQMPSEVKLWVSLGHHSSTAASGVSESDWLCQAQAIQDAGADAIELHLNTPGVAVAGNRLYDFYRVVYHSTRVIKQALRVPVMVKLPVENCDPLRAMEAAWHGGADAIGPTARWRGFVFDLDWRRSPSGAGGYGGTQALPIICWAVAEARVKGIDIPIYAGGGVFHHEAAAKLIMAGSDAVQFGTLGCSLGPGAVREVMADFDRWLQGSRYHGVADLTGDALKLLRLSPADVAARRDSLADAYQAGQPDLALCDGCGWCEDACWHQAISVQGGKAVKARNCIGCGYCYQVCPTGALSVDAGAILAQVAEERGF
jgi:dihydropyrimidine dehydrogenase (NAD+) subunit PreA